MLRCKNIKLLLLLACTIIQVAGMAQSISATFVADSTHIKIGEQLPVKFNLRYTKTLTPEFPQWKDTIGTLEIVRAEKIDTVNDGNSIILSQQYVVSAYDSGEYSTGVQKVFFKNTAHNADSVFSNNLVVQVNTVPVDTSKPVKAIKAPLSLPYSWEEFLYYYIALGILLLLIGAGVGWYIYQKNKPAPPVRPKPKEPAHVWARAELKKLEEDKLWQKGEVKMYYTRLSEILRLYLEFRYGYYAMESTTAEIEIKVDSFHVKRIAKEKLLEILGLADLAKFAKLQPLPDENIKNMERAYAFVELTEPKEEPKDEKK